MDTMFNGIFWGVLLILIGLITIINVVFHIHIPIGRLLFALFFIYIGLNILIGNSSCKQKENTILFSDSRFDTSNVSEEYNVIFGRGIIDLAKITLKQEKVYIKSSTVFGASMIKTNPNLPTKIIVTSVFAGARLPDNNTVVFGQHIYKTAGFKEDQPYVEVKADVVFGGLEVIESRAEE